MVNLSSLAKITDKETLDIVLRAVCRPMVQLSIPEKYLSPVCDPVPKSSGQKHLEKIKFKLLPNRKKAILKLEAMNNPTRLLAAVMYYKLKKKFLNTVTQKECVEMFAINEKQLSQLIMGCKNFSGTNCLTRKRKNPKDKENKGKKSKKDILATLGKASDQLMNSL